jgi:hypothetical protein
LAGNQQEGGMTDISPQPEPKRRRWGRMLAVACLLGIGVYSCAQWSGEGFRKMLAFTTADTEALRRLSPDPTKPTFRFTLKTNEVYSAACDGNLARCTYDRLTGEKDTIKLPRSIIYEFPTLLVNGVEKDGSAIHLTLWHKSLDPAFFGGTPVDTLMVLDDKGLPTQERWKDRQARNMRAETMVHVTLRNDYWSASSTFAKRFDPPPPAPTCDIEDRGNGIVIYRHKQGYEPSRRSDPEVRKLKCKIGFVDLYESSNDSYAIFVQNKDKSVELQIYCYQVGTLCNSSSFFENWGYFYKLNRSVEDEFIEIHRRVTSLIKSSIVDRSYPVPSEGSH